MKKILFQAVIIISLIFTVWFALSRVDWMKIFKVEQITNKTEKKLGDLFWELYNNSGKEIKNAEAIQALDSILSKICVSNTIDKSQVKLHMVQSDEINAFALPNRHLVINTGLILAAEDEAELAGVISHEIAHMELNHVMKKLVKEVGLSVLISMTTGSSSSEQVKEAVKLLSSSAYDRSLEKEADIKAVEYLKKSKINPVYFARFLSRLSEKEPAGLKYFSWISTHPDSKERAEYITALCSKNTEYPQSVVSRQTWDNLRQHLSDKKENQP